MGEVANVEKQMKLTTFSFFRFYEWLLKLLTDCL